MKKNLFYILCVLILAHSAVWGDDGSNKKGGNHQETVAATEQIGPVKFLGQKIDVLITKLNETIKSQSRGVVVSPSSVDKIAKASASETVKLIRGGTSEEFEKTPTTQSSSGARDKKKYPQDQGQDFSSDDEDLPTESSLEDDDMTPKNSAGGRGEGRRSKKREFTKVVVLPSPLYKYRNYKGIKIKDEFIIKQYIVQENGQPRCAYIDDPTLGEEIFVVNCEINNAGKRGKKQAFPSTLDKFNFQFEIDNQSIVGNVCVFIVLSRVNRFSKIEKSNSLLIDCKEYFFDNVAPNKKPLWVDWEQEMGGVYNQVVYCYVLVAVNDFKGGNILYYKIFPMKFMAQDRFHKPND